MPSSTASGEGNTVCQEYMPSLFIPAKSGCVHFCLLHQYSDAVWSCRFFVTILMAIVTATLFLRTNLHPDSVESGNLYFSVIFFSLIALMFDGFAEETLTVSRISTFDLQRNMLPA